MYNGKKVIPIALYCDEFNPDSAVSPHAQDSKINAFYYSFPTLPDFVAVKLRNIFIALLYRSKDIDQNEVSKHGMDPALLNLLEVLIPLEKEGIIINVDGVKETVFIVAPQFFGDNFALNTVFGLNRSFSAYYTCRACTVHKQEMEHLI